MSFTVLGKKKFSYIGITISVNVLNKSRGSEMHWGGGIMPTKGQYLPCYVQTYLYECRRLLFFSSVFAIMIEVFFVSLKSELYVCIYPCSIVIITK